MSTDAATTTDPIRLAAGAMERYCDDRGIPMPTPGLARALAEVAAPFIAAAERERIIKLAEDREATAWGVPPGDSNCYRREFASVLREPTP